MRPLEGQVAVVTGASSGVGRAIAIALAREGAVLCLVGRRKAALDAVIAEARDAGGRSRGYETDLSREDEVRRLVAEVGRDVEGVDILVHSAGEIHLGTFETAAAADFDRHYQVNVRAPYVLTQGWLASLKARRGQVVFVNSSAGLTARASVGQYAASKHALKALADSLREEVNPSGVRVLSLYLGRTASRMQADVHAAEGKAYRPELLVQPEDVAAVAIQALALPRTVEVTEISLRPLVKH